MTAISHVVAFDRYSRDASFTVLAANRGFLLAMAAGLGLSGSAGLWSHRWDDDLLDFR